MVGQRRQDRADQSAGWQQRIRVLSAWVRTAALKSIHFWLVVAMVAVGGILHYAGGLTFEDENGPFGLTEHSMDRILLMVPVLYAGFMFGSRTGFLTLAIVTLLMVPRALLQSPNRAEALVETSSVFLVSSLVLVWFSGQQREKQRRQEALTKLEIARQGLASHVEIITKRERQLAAINDVCRVVAESLDLPHILQRILDKTVEVMGVPVALVFLQDKTGQVLELVAHRGVSHDLARALAAIRIGEGFNGRVAQRGEAMIVDNALEDPRLCIPQVREESLRSQLIVPLRSGGPTIGTLCVAVRSSRRFSPEDVEMLTAIGSQVGIAIENARLYQEALASQERYRDLFDNATVAILVHDLNGVITAANKACADLTGYLPTELIGMNGTRLFPSHALSTLAEVEQNLLRGEAATEPYEVPMTRKDGAELIVSLTTGLISENGQTKGFQHIARDETERRRMRDTLNYYIRQILSAQEEERKRIARELHDETAQSLLLISQRLDSLSSDPHSTLSSEVRAYLEGIREVVARTLANLRRLTQDLRPRILDDLGLVAALEWLADDLERQTGLRVTVEVVGPQRPLRPEAQLLLFRIAQEALSNVRRHAVASQASIVLNHGPDRMSLVICDNGRGFQMPARIADLAAAGKLGILGMHERARLLNGIVTIHSGPGQGTVVTAELPA